MPQVMRFGAQHPQPDGQPVDIRIDRLHFVRVNLTPDGTDPDDRKDLWYFLLLALQNFLSSTRSQSLPVRELQSLLMSRTAPAAELEMVREWLSTIEAETTGELAPQLLGYLRDHYPPRSYFDSLLGLVQSFKNGMIGKRRTLVSIGNRRPELNKTVSWVRRELCDAMWSLHGMFNLLEIQAVALGHAEYRLNANFALDQLGRWVSIHLLRLLLHPPRLSLVPWKPGHLLTTCP